jgi:hypothetical protein
MNMLLTLTMLVVSLKSPILDTRTYNVEFPDGSSVELSICVSWKDGSTSWEKLANLKESYNNGKRQDRFIAAVNKQFHMHNNGIIAAVDKQFHKPNFKFGFEVPRTVARAQEIDKENGNTLWEDMIKLEMEAVRIATRFEEQMRPCLMTGDI